MLETETRRQRLSKLLWYATCNVSALIAISCSFRLASSPCSAQEINWIVPADTPADWHDPDHWTYSHEGTTPEDFWTFRIDGNGVVNLDSGTVRGWGGVIGEVGNGQLVQTGGNLELFGDGIPSAYLGTSPGALGRYELAGGSAKISYIAVGFQGHGELLISDGMLDFDRGISIGATTGGTGLVVQTGGVVGRTEANLRNEINLGVSGFGAGRYELMDGQVVTMNLVIDAGTFQQDGGAVTIGEDLFLRGGESEQLAEFRMGSDDATVAARRLVVRSYGSGPRAQFWQDAGNVSTLFTQIGNGSYQLANGHLWADTIAVGADAIGAFDAATNEGRFVQTGGTVVAANVSVRGSKSFDGSRTATGRYELQGGTAYIDRLFLGGERDSDFVQSGGRMFVNTLELAGYGPTGGHATLTMSGGRTIVNDSLIVGATPESSGDFDFQHQAGVVLQTGLGSSVYFGEGTAIRNAESASFIIGSDSLVGVAENLDVGQLLGSIQHRNVVTYVPGQTIHIKEGQRAQVGTDGTWRSDVKIDGFAYDSPARGVTRIEGNLIVGATGNLQLDDDRSRVLINGHEDAGVYGGTARIAQLTVRGSEGPSRFTVRDSGSLTVSQLLKVNEQQSFELMSGQVDAARVEIGGGGKYVQSGGATVADRFEITPSPSGLGRGELSGGTLQADYFLVSSSGRFVQSGGSVIVNELAAESYLMQAGDLTVRTSLNNHFGDGKLDLSGASVTVNVEGGIVDMGPRSMFVQSQNATLNIDEHSLVIVPAGYDLPSKFANFNNAGIIQDVSQPLVIPADREIHGAGDIRALPTVQIYGKLVGEAALNGLSMSRFQIFPGAVVDLPQGYLISQRTTGSSVSGGSLNATDLTIEGTFTQSGGDVTLDTVTNRTRSTYSLTGGTLKIRDQWTSGILDFGESAATLVLGENAVLSLDRLFINEGQQATLIGERNSLIITNSESLPESLFGTFSSAGMVHVIGQPLTVPSDKLLSGGVHLIGGLINSGQVAPGRGIGTISIGAGDYTQSATGLLDLAIGKHADDLSTGGIAADFLSVEGTANLDGLLKIEIADDFMPAVGDSYTLLRANQVVGEFADVSFPEIIAGLKWQLSYQADTVTLSVASRLPLDDEPLGDFDHDGQLSAADVDALTAQINSGEYLAQFDVNSDSYLDEEDRRFWIEEQTRVLYGDANFDGEFNSSDLVTVFIVGQYEDDVVANSTWESGDWDGNGDYDTGDLVVAFMSGHYEEAAAGAVRSVPEPNSLAIIAHAIWIAPLLRRKNGT